MILPGTCVRLRPVPAAILCFVSLGGLYLGMVAASGAIAINDKVQHAVFFFCFGGSLYWVLALPKQQSLHLTAAVTGAASILSEVAQSSLTVRSFDSVDIAANLVGSGCSIMQVRSLPPGTDPNCSSLNVWCHGGYLEEMHKVTFTIWRNITTDLEQQRSATHGFETDAQVPSSDRANSHGYDTLAQN